jgi:mRNA interferase MazF
MERKVVSSGHLSSGGTTGIAGGGRISATAQSRRSSCRLAFEPTGLTRMACVASGGKLRPVVVLQTDLLNRTGHPSTWIVPCASRLAGESLLRVCLPTGAAGNDRECEVMIDQSRAVDNRRVRRRLGQLPSALLREVKEKIRRLVDL